MIVKILTLGLHLICLEGQVYSRVVNEIIVVALYTIDIFCLRQLLTHKG